MSDQRQDREGTWVLAHRPFGRRFAGLLSLITSSVSEILTEAKRRDCFGSRAVNLRARISFPLRHQLRKIAPGEPNRRSGPGADIGEDFHLNFCIGQSLD
jgi:hypothetical protein